MPKLGMGPIRRKQLIEAVLNCIDEWGLSETTTQRISKQAQVSAGIINHYFSGKDGLLEAAMRQILKDLQLGVKARLSTIPQEDFKARVHAIIDGNFDHTQMTSAARKAWLAFWAEAMHKPELRRLQNVNAKRLVSNLTFELNKAFPRSQAQHMAEVIAAAIDGVWLREALNITPSDVITSRKKVEDVFHLFLARYEH
ncbi:transcriptional regulator BetI [Endozoicomonas sp. SM1973]|uniref:HTH-type transcriptional regulator BetI n=1 Tax=Spartinivicinus marinus TaxID=2994442 RepID=A0A853HYQ9_9GAMM|nr:transcriptional regulator BetI [Spartinivicinus marinus]MCX4028918.1 transcriptional regulator BetI [Spartinivicinus marinus]NYZ65499.1 transcriptional regulator BetI [Spartinivicinus marinus]